jgi:DNA-binding CsgD family transcriptional regulator
VLVGRTAECAAIDQILAGARNGSSGVIVVRGAPGIGKSALLDYAMTNARDFAIARVTGVESEVGLGYAAIHQLVLPFLDHVVELPDPQRHALESVFGLADGAAPSSLVVFLAVLTLLDHAARERPMLLVIDDAQWLDDESARVLTFVARRLHADPVAMLFAVRDTGVGHPDVFKRLPQLVVLGLPEDDARTLLTSVAGSAIDVKVADRLVEETEGNPLALTEVVAELTAEQLRGDAPLPEPVPVGLSLPDQFAARARLLPPAGRTVLLLASAERLGDPALLHRAARLLGATWEEAVTTIEATGLVTFAPAVRFRHPLIRSAVYHGALPAERRRAHRALAEALDGDDDVDRRAWHLAAAAAAPDEEVARALELAGGRVFHRGGTQAAAEFLLRASELTPDPVRRVDRLLATVRLRAAEGDAARAQPLLDSVLTRVHDGHQRVEAEWTQGLIWLDEGRGRDALHALARAVASIEEYDGGFALDALITAEDAAIYAGSLRDDAPVDAIASTALRLLPEGDCATPAELLVRGIAVRLTDGYAASAPMLRSALAGLRQQVEETGNIATPNAHERANVLHLLAVSAAAALLDDGALQAVTRSWVDFGRRTQTLTTLPIALDTRSVAEILAARFRAAASAIAEAEEILSLVGSRGHIGDPGLGELLLHAYRGDEEKTRDAAERRARDARERGSGGDLDHSRYALAILDLGSGRYVTALEHCRGITDHSVPFSTIALPVLIEAAVRCDELATATTALDRFSARAIASRSNWAEGLLACMRALLAAGDEAESQYQVALDRLTRCTVAFDLARAQLLYGEWLRRARRRREAREPLRAALECFDGIGARAFAERTRRELAATGEHSRPRSDATRGLLTGQEAQIARLVADGCTNSEIASQLFISLRTVEYHLNKVYRKLGVNTRTQLARLERAG